MSGVHFRDRETEARKIHQITHRGSGHSRTFRGNGPDLWFQPHFQCRRQVLDISESPSTPGNCYLHLVQCPANTICLSYSVKWTTARSKLENPAKAPAHRRCPWCSIEDQNCPDPNHPMLHAHEQNGLSPQGQWSSSGRGLPATRQLWRGGAWSQ